MAEGANAGQAGGIEDRLRPRRWIDIGRRRLVDVVGEAFGVQLPAEVPDINWAEVGQIVAAPFVGDPEVAANIVGVVLRQSELEESLNNMFAQLRENVPPEAQENFNAVSTNVINVVGTMAQAYWTQTSVIAQKNRHINKLNIFAGFSCVVALVSSTLYINCIIQQGFAQQSELTPFDVLRMRYYCLRL